MNAHSIFSLEMSWETMGGTHPLHETEFANIDIRTGHQLSLADCFVEGYKPALDSVYEVSLRKLYHLSIDAPLTNFDFKDKRFTLNDRFKILEDSLVFQFGEYEITGYSPPGIWLSVPWSEVRHLIRPDGPLGWVLNKTVPQQ